MLGIPYGGGRRQSAACRNGPGIVEPLPLYLVLGARQALTSDDTSIFGRRIKRYWQRPKRTNRACQPIIDDSLLSAIDRIKERLPHKAATPGSAVQRAVTER